MFSFSAVGQQWHSNVVQNLHVGNYLPQVKNIFVLCDMVFRVGCYIIHIAFCSVLIAAVQFVPRNFRYSKIVSLGKKLWRESRDARALLAERWIALCLTV